MPSSYNIFFAAEIAADAAPDTVRAKLGALFKASDETLDKLFSGQPQLIKRNCDKATALKYKAAMEKAGAVPIIKRAEQGAPEAPAKDEGLTLAALGSDLLAASEKAPEPRPVVAPAYDLDELGAQLAEPAEVVEPVLDLSHLSTGEVGEDIPTLPTEAPSVVPSGDAIDLTPEGTDFSDCAPDEAPDLNLDLSELSVAETGADVLPDEYRKKDDAEAPDTSHLTLA